MQYAILRLSKKDDHKNFHDLKFKLLNNKFVPKWVSRVLDAQQHQYPISEPWALYNINETMNLNFIKDNLNRLMKEVDAEHQLFGIQIEDIKDQNLLNKIHAIFEQTHGALDQWKTNPIFENKSEMFRKNLSEINQFVHACESFGRIPYIRVVWFDLPKTKLFEDADYELFTNKRTFGSLYHLYSDVGKNIESLARDNDDHHHDVIPNLHFSADCVCYFHDDKEIDVEQMEKKQKDYIKRNRNYLAEKGYTINDKRLTTGRIEIARLETDLTKEQLLIKIKDFDHIQSFFII